LSLTGDFKYRFRYASPVVRLIIVNAIVFALALLVNLWGFLFLKVKLISAPYLELPGGLYQILYKPWTLLTYQFSHFGAFHFAFNMLILYFSGAIFLDFFRKKDVWRVYIFGGVSAAVLFYLSANFVPAFKNNHYTLIGASGSVMAILFAAAVYGPDIRLHLFGIIPVKLKWLAIGLLVLDLIGITEANAGGHIAHLGGAIFGTLFAYYRKGTIRLRLFEPVIRQKPAAAHMKAEVGHNTSKHSGSARNKPLKEHAPSQEEIDAILDKISKSGYDRLSKEEKDILFKASQE
jgi:membrane associated rhomboid family serine protease